MKKVCTVVGARPQFIKLSVVSRALRGLVNEVVIHTGQHYDYNMSDIFFEDMDIPKPAYNLGVSGGTHGLMTGKMMIELEKVFLSECPDMVLVFGDTNSTLAAALTAVKLHIPVCHVESGNRLGTLTNPEEVNRIITDHVSSLLFVCTSSGVENLKKEGICQNVYLVGDPMYDAFLYYSKDVGDFVPDNIVDLDNANVVLPKDYYYLTCHREENTDNDEKLVQIFEAMETLDAKTVYPVHPRNHERANRILKNNGFSKIVLTKPVGYKESIYLVNHAKKIVTDSGGLQREAFFAKKQCVTIFDYVGWPETMVNGCNRLSKPNKDDIIEKINSSCLFDASYMPFGYGNSSEKIASILLKYLGM